MKPRAASTQATKQGTILDRGYQPYGGSGGRSSSSSRR
jgi:hypothetical protein